MSSYWLIGFGLCGAVELGFLPIRTLLGAVAWRAETTTLGGHPEVLRRASPELLVMRSAVAQEPAALQAAAPRLAEQRAGGPSSPILAAIDAPWPGAFEGKAVVARPPEADAESERSPSATRPRRSGDGRSAAGQRQDAPTPRASIVVAALGREARRLRPTRALAGLPEAQRMPPQSAEVAPAIEAPAVVGPARRAPRRKETRRGVGSCEAAVAAYREDIAIGGGRGPRDITSGQYGAIFNNGSYFAHCGVPAATSVNICVAIRNGRAEGVTVRTSPGSRRLRRCIAQAVRGLTLPSHPKLDVTHTSFKPS